MSDLVRLRYVGERPVTFLAQGVGSVETGAEFDVPEAALLSFMRRADIEHAGECPSPPCRCGEEPEPEAGEDASASQDRETSGGRRAAKRAVSAPGTSP